MLSKNRIKFIKSLQIKKFRKEHGLFLVEGAKSVSELLRSDYKIHTIFLTEEYRNCWADEFHNQDVSIETATAAELGEAGTFESNNAALALVEMKPNQEILPEAGKITLVLDEIKDPGNLGTIIRIADWYGIKNIICSENTVELYNPKVIASTMGSFTRTAFYYTNLSSYLEKCQKDLPVYGAALDGKNLHEIKTIRPGLLVMGNESNGISDEVRGFLTDIIAIPGSGNAESLNVAVATAVMLDNFIRMERG